MTRLSARALSTGLVVCLASIVVGACNPEGGGGGGGGDPMQASSSNFVFRGEEERREARNIVSFRNTTGGTIFVRETVKVDIAHHFTLVEDRCAGFRIGAGQICQITIGLQGDNSNLADATLTLKDERGTGVGGTGLELVAW